MHNREQIWRTADGRRVTVGDMEDSHLVNVINWILDNRDSYTASILKNMVAEAEYRKTTLFASRLPYPQKINGRWVLVDPQSGKGQIVPPPKEYIEAVKDNEMYQTMRLRTEEKRKKRRQDFLL